MIQNWGGRTDTTSKPCTCTNKMTLDYVNYSVTFPNVFFILRLCPHLSRGHPRTLLGLVFPKLARVADRRKSQISFFSVNLVFFVTVCCRLVWTANSKLIFSHFSSFVGQIFLEKPLRVPLLVKVLKKWLEAWMSHTRMYICHKSLSNLKGWHGFLHHSLPWYSKRHY